SRDGQIRLWDIHQRHLLWKWALRDQRGYGTGINFSPNNRWLVCFTIAGTRLALYDLTNPQQSPVELSNVDPSSIWCAVFDPDNRNLVTSGNDGLIKFWNLQTFKVALQLEHSHGPHVCFSFSPDGNLLASMDANGTVKLWDAAPR